MASYEDTAPELSKVVDKAAAVDFANNVVEPTVPVYKTIDQLSAPVLAKLKLWLKWFGMEKRPLFPKDMQFLNYSPAEVAGKTGMSRAYVLNLLAERAAIIGEVSTYSDSAFQAHPAITSVVSDAPSTGDITISGTELASIAGGVSGATFNRPGGGTVVRSKAQIEAGGGSVGALQIVIASGTLPVTLDPGDEVSVTADGNESSDIGDGQRQRMGIHGMAGALLK